MPAKSKQQQKLMGMALAKKRKGEPVPKGLEGMTEEQLKDYAKTKHKGLPKMKKKSATIDYKHDFVGKGALESLGRVGNLITPTMWALAPIQGQKSITRKHRKKYEDLVAMMNAGDTTGALENTKVRLGARDFIDDALWTRGEGEKDKKWYGRLGGRIMHNKHNTPLTKAYGSLVYPLAYLMSSANRSGHYNPITDVAHVDFDSDGILRHELGHALDFNRGTAAKNKSLASRLGRDLRFATYLSRLPGGQEVLEFKANSRAMEALVDGMKAKAKGKDKVNVEERFLDNLEDGQRYLPAAYSTYITRPGGVLSMLSGGYGSAAALPVAAGIRGSSDETNKIFAKVRKNPKARAALLKRIISESDKGRYPSLTSGIHSAVIGASGSDFKKDTEEAQKIIDMAEGKEDDKDKKPMRKAAQNVAGRKFNYGGTWGVTSRPMKSYNPQTASFGSMKPAPARASQALIDKAQAQLKPGKPRAPKPRVAPAPVPQQQAPVDKQMAPVPQPESLPTNQSLVQAIPSRAEALASEARRSQPMRAVNATNPDSFNAMVAGTNVYDGILKDPNYNPYQVMQGDINTGEVTPFNLGRLMAQQG